MRSLLSGLCALALVLGIAAGCTDTSSDRIESAREQTPSASPPTAPSDDAADSTSKNQQGTSGALGSSMPEPGKARSGS